MGGGISANFNDPNSQLIVSNSYFFNNTADFAACFAANNPTGTLHLEKNIFIENIGRTEFRVSIGSGSILLSSVGSPNTFVKYYHNINLFNQVECKGILFNFSFIACFIFFPN